MWIFSFNYTGQASEISSAFGRNARKKVFMNFNEKVKEATFNRLGVVKLMKSAEKVENYLVDDLGLKLYSKVTKSMSLAWQHDVAFDIESSRYSAELTIKLQSENVEVVLYSSDDGDSEEYEDFPVEAPKFTVFKSINEILQQNGFEFSGKNREITNGYSGGVQTKHYYYWQKQFNGYWIAISSVAMD